MKRLKEQVIISLKMAVGVIVATLLAKSLGLDFYNTVTTIVIDNEMRCLINSVRSRTGYTSPALPNLTTLKNDYEVIDVLVDHIKTLRKELKTLSGEECM